MTINRTTLLDLPLPVTGTESGTWGDITNKGLTEYLDIAIAGMSSLTSANFTAGALTIETTEGDASATNISATSAQYAGFRVSSLATNSTITVGNTGSTLGRSYRLINADSTYTLTFKATGQTGVTLQPGQSAVVAFNGTDYALIGTIGPTVSVASGGTGLTTATAYGLIAAGTTSTGNFQQVSGTGTSGQVLTSNGAGALPTWQSGASGNVTTSGNNAFTGANTFYNATGQTFAPATTNDGIIIQGRAGGSSTYRVTFATATLSGNRTLTFPDATDTAAVLGTAQTFTALQTFSGSTSVAATKLTNAKEVATISATAATGTINYDVTTQSVLYYTSNASANWTVNFRGSSGTSLNTLMSTGESITVAFLVTQGSTAYYNSAVQVDGSSVTPKYQGGTAWSAGNASSIDAYVYTIVKTGSAAFTIFASQTRFA